VKTLRGPSRKILVLPYSFVRVPTNGNDRVLPWQLLSSFGGKDLSSYIDLICVVIPGAVDATSSPVPVPDGAASEVVLAEAVVQFEAPGAAKEILALCQEYNAKDAK
jgi:hypothetical protein